MAKLKITYYDGTIQICSPKSEGANSFNQDRKGLAETVAGKMYRSEHAYKSYEVLS